jgi:hypothetical protein
MNWIGITNENEFYSQHYLSEIFSGDVRGVLGAWSAKETEAREAARSQGRKEPDWHAPHSVLGLQWREALNLLEVIRRPQPPADRLDQGRELIRFGLQTFDLPYSPARQPLTGADDLELPSHQMAVVSTEPKWVTKV